MPIGDEPRAHGGLVATHELHTLGYDRAAIARAVRAGELRRVRQGWYSDRNLAPEFARAARVGGVATCATALASVGGWVLADRRLHVAVRPNACQLRTPRDSRRRLESDDVVVHWALTSQTNRVRRDIGEALLDYAGCAEPLLVAASANALVREHATFRRDWPELRPRFPQRCQPALALVDGVCESGTEFAFWARLGDLHRLIDRQVVIAGVGRVDFLVGSRLVVEIDGFDHHGGREQYESDRDRDAALSRLGYRVLRFSHRQVFERWAWVEASVRAALARGDHY